MISLVFLTFIAYVTILVRLRCRGSRVRPVTNMYDTSGDSKKELVTDEMEEAKMEAVLFTGIALIAAIFVVSYYNYYI